MNRKVKTLIKNTGIFAIANMLTRVMMLVIVPLFSYYLTTTEFGIVDTVTTTTSLLLPIATVSIYDAVLRFGMKEDADNKQILSNALFMVVGLVILLVIIFPVIPSSITKYYFVFCCILVFDEIISIFNSFTKSIGQVMLSAEVSVLRTGIFLSTSLIFVVALKWNVRGYIFSIIIAQIVAIIAFVLKIKVVHYVRFSVDFKMLKDMIVYSLPLMVNSIMWWVMQSSDKYALIFFKGMSSNGIYSVANKIPSIITMVHSVFFQAWQLSAIEEFGNEETSAFYSDIFDKYVKISILAVVSMIAVIKPVSIIIFSDDYNSVWRYSFALMCAAVFSSFSSFFATIYIASENTKGTFFTSIFGAVLNILLNFMWIPKYGIQGASLATCFSYIFIWIVRVIDTRKYLRVKFDIIYLLINCVAILLVIYEFLHSDSLIPYVMCAFTLLYDLVKMKNLKKINV